MAEACHCTLYTIFTTMRCKNSRFMYILHQMYYISNVRVTPSSELCEENVPV